MNIFHKITLQSLKNSRTRTLVTIMGVVLSTALITGVTTFGVSLLDYLTRGAMMKYGDWHAVFWDVPSEFIREQVEDDRVEETAVIENIGYARMEGDADSNRPYLFVAGYSPQALEQLPVCLISGRMPENSSEAIISGSVTMNQDVQLTEGDILSLQLGQRMRDGQILGQKDAYTAEEQFVSQKERSYTIVGICQTPVFMDSDAPGYTVITRAEAGLQSGRGECFVSLKKPEQIGEYVKEAGKYTCTKNDSVLRFMGLSDEKLFQTLLYSTGGIVLVIIMTGSVFLIYNAFQISLNERIHQFGILASVGATKKQLCESVLFEGLCIGAAGIPLGIVTGLGSVYAVIQIVADRFTDTIYSGVPLLLKLSVPAILLTVVISLFTILISAYIPAKHAVKIPVLECIRQTNEIKLEAKTVTVSKWTEHLLGLPGMLAEKNFKRNRRRYRSIVLSLVLSIA